jgi:hypothetical protein
MTAQTSTRRKAQPDSAKAVKANRQTGPDSQAESGIGGRVTTLGATVSDVAASAAEEVKDRAIAGAESLRQAAGDRAASARDATAEAGERLSGSLRKAAGSNPDGSLAARALTLAADGFAAAAERVDGATLSSVVADARALARRHPAATATLAAAAGFALVRLLKAAPEEVDADTTA